MPMHDPKAIGMTSRRLVLAALTGLWMMGMAGVTYGHGAGEEAPETGFGAGGGQAPEADMFVSELIGRQLALARSLMEKGKYGEAITHLEAMKAGSRAYNRYEKAILNQTLGYAYATADDYSKAVAAFARALSFKALPKEATLAVMQNLGQLYIATEHYDRGIAVLEEWMKRAPPTAIAPRIRVLLGNAYFRRKDYDKAAEQLRRAIAAVKRPDRSWYQLLASVDGQWGHYTEMADVLQQAVADYPGEKAFWQQLAAAYRRGHDDKKAAAVLALSCRRGLCSADEKVYLARLYLFLGVPLISARILQQALEDDTLRSRALPWMLLAESWQRAREPDKAETAYRQASDRSKEDGTPDYRLGQLYVQQEKWQVAADAFTRALRRGHLASPGRARLLLGVAQLYLGRVRESATSFEAAQRDPEVKAEARRWLSRARRSADQSQGVKGGRLQDASDRPAKAQLK